MGAGSLSHNAGDEASERGRMKRDEMITDISSDEVDGKGKYRAR